MSYQDVLDAIAELARVCDAAGLDYEIKSDGARLEVEGFGSLFHHHAKGYGGGGLFLSRAGGRFHDRVHDINLVAGLLQKATE